MKKKPINSESGLSARNEVVPYFERYDWMRADLTKTSVPILHMWLKQIYNTYVPPMFKVDYGTGYNKADHDPQTLITYFGKLFDEIITRPERSTLVDIELGWMQQQVLRLSGPKLTTSASLTEPTSDITSSSGPFKVDLVLDVDEQHPRPGE